MDSNSWIKQIREAATITPNVTQHASHQYEVIMESISNFQNNLDDNRDIALQLTSFGQTMLMQVTSIGYSNPNLIHFYGYVNGRESELIQHVTQLNFLITSTPKEDQTRKPFRVAGFTNDED